MAILVSRGGVAPYLVYTHAEYLKQGPFMERDFSTGEITKPRVRVKMNSTATGEPAKLRITTDDLELSHRAYNCLINIKFAYQIAMMSDAELLRIDNLGRHTLYEIRAELARCGFLQGNWRPNA